MEISGINFTPTILISGSYNIFNSGFNCAGSYMCSGLYESESFKLPIYIGGSENIAHRITKDHIPQLNGKYHCNSIFEDSWHKHQNDGFVWWLLEKCVSGEALIVEQKYLDLYRPFADEGGGFNFSHFANSGFKGRKHTLESKLKQSQNNPRLWLGKKHTLEELRKMSESQKGEKNWLYGKHHSLETRKKLSEKRKISSIPFKKPIKQLDLQGNLIKIWDSVTEAAKYFNVNKHDIRRASKLKTRSCKGFRWER